MRFLPLLAATALVLAGCTAPTDGPATEPMDPGRGGGSAEDGPGGTVASTQSADGRTGHPLEGQPAPHYEAVDLDGDPVTLADHAGRPVLFHIWASWCSVCEAEEPSLHALHADYGDRVDFVSVSIDGQRYEDAMRREAAEAPGAQWWDPDDAVRPLFQVSYQPITVFLDADGTVDTVWQGQRADRTTLRGNEELARDVLGRIVAGSAST